MSEIHKGGLMSSPGHSPAAPIGRMETPTDKNQCSEHAQVGPNKLGLWQDTATIH